MLYDLCAFNVRETVLKRFFAAFRFQQHEVIALVDAAYAADIGFIVAGI